MFLPMSSKFNSCIIINLSFFSIVVDAFSYYNYL